MIAADLVSVPRPAPPAENGCSVETALICAFQAARGLPRAPGNRRPTVTAVLASPLIIFGLVSLIVASSPAALTPGALALTAAAALTVLAASRAGGGLLLAASVLMLPPAVAAIEILADLQRQLPRPDRGDVLTACLYSDVAVSAASTVAPFAALAALLLAGPALLVWSLSTHRSGDSP
jgi:hypothetical protein